MSCLYTPATSVNEVVSALIEAKGEAHLIAGGVALVILGLGDSTVGTPRLSQSVPRS